MIRISCLFATMAMCHLAALAAAQQTTPQVPTVEFTVEVLGSKVAEFNAKMDEYARLRRRLQKGLAGLVVTDKPMEIRRAERLLAERIRQARADAGRHDIFTDESRRAFRQMLRPLTTAANCEFIRDDNPGEWGWAVNSEYPKRRPVSSVPPSCSKCCRASRKTCSIGFSTPIWSFTTPGRTSCSIASTTRFAALIMGPRLNVGPGRFGPWLMFMRWKMKSALRQNSVYPSRDQRWGPQELPRCVPIHVSGNENGPNPVGDRSLRRSAASAGSDFEVEGLAQRSSQAFSRAKSGVPDGIRTRVLALKGPRPGPLDDGDAR